MSEPFVIDLSKGSSDTYQVTERHGLLPPCPMCGRHTHVTLDGGAYYAYFVKGEYVQNAFPNLTADERELLITGVHPGECNKKLWGPLEDLVEEDED